MTSAELVRGAKNFEGRSLFTVRGKEFRVGVYVDCPFFIPASTGMGRSDGKKAMEAFLERWNQFRSPVSSDYKDVTRNASYFLALIAAIENSTD